MDSFQDHTTKSHPTVTVTKTSDADSTIAEVDNNHKKRNSKRASSSSSAPSSLDDAKTKHRRPGEAIMQSDDPSTAALRAWARDKQLQVPGSDGSFVLGRISGGAGAVSGGPMFLPRKEDVVAPPFLSMDRGPVRKVKEEEEEGGRKEKKRRSISDFFRRKGEGKGKLGTGGEREEDGDLGGRVVR